MVDRCPSCRAPLPAAPASSRRRCPRCGAPLAAAPSPPAAAPVVPDDEVAAWARRLAAVVLDDIALYRPELLAAARSGGLPAGPLAEELARAWTWWRERVAGGVDRPQRLFREEAARRLGIAWPGPAGG